MFDNFLGYQSNLVCLLLVLECFCGMMGVLHNDSHESLPLSLMAPAFYICEHVLTKSIGLLTSPPFAQGSLTL